MYTVTGSIGDVGDHTFPSKTDKIWIEIHFWIRKIRWCAHFANQQTASVFKNAAGNVTLLSIFDDELVDKWTN